MPESRAPGVYAELHDLVRLRQLTSGFNFLPRQPVQSLLSGHHASKLRGRGLNFEEIRHYLPGDDIRQIDWKVTARTREPHSRVYSEERERSVLMVVDQRLSMFFGSQRQFKSFTAAEAAALVAWRTIAVKDRVGMILFDDTGCQSIRPQRSQDGVMRLLRALIDKNHALQANSSTPADPAMLNRALAQTQRLASHDCLIVLISDGNGIDAETRKHLTQMSQHNDVLVVFVFDPLESAIPDAGRLTVSDGARFLTFESKPAAVRERFQSEFAARRQQAHRFLLTRETPVLPLSTAEDTIQQVARALGHRPPGGHP